MSDFPTHGRRVARSVAAQWIARLRGPRAKSLRLNVRIKRGFDGYVIDPQPGEALTVIVLDRDGSHVLAAIPLVTTPSPASLP